MVDGAAVRNLAAWRSQGVVTSLYLDVDGARSPRRVDVVRRAGALFRAARARAHLDGSAPVDDVQVERELSAMDRWLGAELDRTATRGVALFAAPDGPLAALPLPVPVRDQVVVDRVPDLAQLCLVLAAQAPALVVVTDGQRGRLAAWSDDGLHGVDVIEDDLPRQVDTDTELAGFGHHREELVRDHLRRVARRVTEELDLGLYRYVVVAGPGTSAAQLEAYLPGRVVARVADRLQLPVAAADDALAAATAAAVTAAEQDRRAALVTSLRERVATGTSAVAGLAPTLGALAEHQVDTLLVEAGLAAPGARCDGCGLLSTGAGGPCPRCGGPLLAVPNVVDDAVTAGFLGGVSLEPLEEGTLADLGRIGALLVRWAGGLRGGEAGA